MSNKADLDAQNLKLKQFYEASNGVFTVCAVDHNGFEELKKTINEEKDPAVRRLFLSVRKFAKQARDSEVGSGLVCSVCDREFNKTTEGPSIVVVCIPYANPTTAMGLGVCADCAGGDWEPAIEVALCDIWPDMRTIDQGTKQ